MVKGGNGAGVRLKTWSLWFLLVFGIIPNGSHGSRSKLQN